MLSAEEAQLDALGRAVADATRRRIIEYLRSHGGATTADLASLAPTMTRFAVMKHLDVLRAAGLLQTMPEGRRRRHYLAPQALMPLRDWLLA